MHEHFNKEEIAEQITALRKKETFSQDLQDIKPWHEATVFSSAGIIFKTNLPMEYNREFFRKVRDLYKKEREVLIEVFGKPDRAPSSLTAYVFGRFEDFEAIMSERASRNKNVFPFDFKAVYFHDDREIFIYYDGGAEFSVLAHELAHHLIQDLYIPSPSRLVSEGFAEYVSYQVAKEDAKREVKDKIEFLKWLDSVGGLEHAFQIFDHWKYYEQAKTRLEYFTARKMFYLIAWSLTQFFLEGGSDFFTDFYAAYVAVESERDSNDIYSTMHYFKEHLSEKEIARLDHDWGAYLLDLNYEQV
jgi:hypothetical protein